jgi:hypothetical protein
MKDAYEAGQKSICREKEAAVVASYKEGYGRKLFDVACQEAAVAEALEMAAGILDRIGPSHWIQASEAHDIATAIRALIPAQTSAQQERK